MHDDPWNTDPNAADSADPDPTDGPQEARTRRVLTGISPRAWEHPADRAALQALRRIPVFDQVIRKVFGLFGEKPVRLAFQANALRVNERQFPRVERIYGEVRRTLDAPERYDLFITQTPMVNAGAYGMEKPFILLNSGAVSLLDDEELAFLIAHELGHIMSGHALYRTMTALLLELAQRGYPLVGLAARTVLLALLEWYRKSELSSDRAALLAVQDPQVVYRTFLKLAGGGNTAETDLDEFLRQAEEYRESEDVADSVFKVLNLMAATHPFHVLRVSEVRAWVESGEYERILGGQYPRRGGDEPGYFEDLTAAADTYSRKAEDFFEEVAGAARRMGGNVFEAFTAAARGTGTGRRGEGRTGPNEDPTEPDSDREPGPDEGNSNPRHGSHEGDRGPRPGPGNDPWL